MRSALRCSASSGPWRSLPQSIRQVFASPGGEQLMDIAGRIAVVTGAAAGTGRVIARTLADLGAQVVLADIDGEGAQAVSAAIGRRGGISRAVRADICDERDVEAIAASAAALGDGPHILVNNAGGWGPAGRQFPEASPAEWGAVLDLNLRAPMRLTQRFLDTMAEAGAGAVVNISSSAGRGGQPYASPEYGAAKAGLIRFTTALGGLRETMGVRVNCIVPDWIGLDRAHAELAQMPLSQRAAMPPLIPPQTVAQTVITLVRDDSLSGRIAVLPGGDSIQLV
jgi:NAD(P)-dependent dehydrogenase (short-subunit alcohol dehydrogenase family)